MQEYLFLGTGEVSVITGFKEDTINIANDALLKRLYISVKQQLILEIFPIDEIGNIFHCS